MTEHTIYINNISFADSDTTFVKINYVRKPLNQIATAEFGIYSMTSAQAALVVKGAHVRIYDSKKYVFYGIIRKITDDADGSNKIIYCEDYSCMLTDRVNYSAGSVDGRKEWSATTAYSIISELVSGIITLGTVSIYTRIGIRAEYDTILETISSIARICGVDWWCWHNGSIPILNVMNRGYTSSRQTFVLGDGSVADEPSTDIRSVYNKIYVLGYGDGINQIRSVAKHATLVRTYLTGNISATQTNLYVNSTTGFAVNNYIMVGMERCRITSIPSSSQMVVTRWVNSNEIAQYVHSSGIEVVLDTYTETSPQTGSSIQQNGLIENRWVDTSIVEQNAVDFLAQRLLAKYKTSGTSGTITYLAPYSDADVGDLITIRNYSGVDTIYRCTSWEYNGEDDVIEIGYSTPGSEEVTTLELQRTLDLNNPYGQGATNVFQLACYENCQDTYPLSMRFFLPDDVVAINKVLLSFKILPYRTYHKETAGHAHTTRVGLQARDNSNRGTQNVYMIGSYWLIDHAQFISALNAQQYTEGFTSNSASATTYGIDTYSQSGPIVTISVGIDGSEQSIGSYSTGSNSIELKSYINKPGNWYNIKFTPAAGQRMRIEANAYLKVFIKSN